MAKANVTIATPINHVGLRRIAPSSGSIGARAMARIATRYPNGATPKLSNPSNAEAAAPPCHNAPKPIANAQAET